MNPPDEMKPDARPRRRGWGPVVASIVAITALAGAVRLYHLGVRSMWVDEAFSLWIARHPGPEIWRWLVRLDTHPPLYYVLLHGWLRLGDGEATLRLLSALFGVLTIPIVYGIGATIGGHRLGALASLLMAVSPLNILYAQEARMYALLTLAAALAMWGLAMLLKAPPARGAGWAAYIAGTVVALWSHNTAILLLVSVNLIVLGWWFGRGNRGGFLRTWMLAQALVLVVWSPWIPAFAHQMLRVRHEFWIPTPSLEIAVKTFQTLYTWGVPPPLWLWADLFVGTLAGLGLWGWRGDRRWIIFCLGLFMVAPASELLISVHRPVFWFYTLIWTSIPVALMIAAGLTQLRGRLWFSAGLASIMAIHLLGLSVYFITIKKVKYEVWDEPAAYVANRVQRGDLILFHDPVVQLPFDYYFRRYGRIVAEHGVPVDVFTEGALEPKMSEGTVPAVQALTRPYRRVWVVYSHDWYTDPQQIIPRALQDVGRLVDHQKFLGVQVYLYVTQGSRGPDPARRDANRVPNWATEGRR